MMGWIVRAAALVAVLSAAAPAAGEVNIDINIGTPPPPAPPIVLSTPPVLVVVPHSSVYYAPSLPYNFFFYAGRYYTLHSGAWFQAPSYRGPWIYVGAEAVPRHVLFVPTSYYKIPPGHLKKMWRGEHGHHGRGHGHEKHHHGDHDD
jgi:hypothetical protein